METARCLARSTSRQSPLAPVVLLALGMACLTVVGSRAADLAPTVHPPLPDDPALFWLVPPSSGIGVAPALHAFARGVGLFNSGNYSAALPLVSDRALASSALADYARYYTGFTQMRLERYDEAEQTFRWFDDHTPIGHLVEAVALRQSELELLRKNPSGALSVLDRLARQKTTAVEDVLTRIARAAELTGDTDRAVAAYRRLYFEFPLSAEGELAGPELTRLDPSPALTPDRVTLELARAERLFAAKRYQPARDAFERLGKTAASDGKELIALRLAECDYYLRRYRASRDALRPYLTRSTREAEARFFHLSATRALGDVETYVALARGFVNDFPKDPWAEETLNNLASHYITNDDDAAADRVFRDLVERFPKGRYGERAAWKIGWLAYRNGTFEDTVRYFEDAAVAFPRADTRPAWLYWAGRAREQRGDTTEAEARYRLAVTDYRNSYYGRLALRRLGGSIAPDIRRASVSVAVEEPRLAPSDATIRQLIALHLYDDAQREVQYAQAVWGDSAALQATVAWIRHQQGLELTARERFDALRGAINMMKRAYPQYIASGGEQLPPEMLGIVFPLDYWPLIRKYADERDLDPYLMAALVNQESTFTADVKSGANAVGLMQLLPSTGRQYARRLKMPYTTRMLTQAEPNIRMGTAYFKDLVDRFGDAYFALASYNAGEHRIARWRAEKPAMPADEFIDDIPFPETQNYVKKILSMAEDYRRLYGGGLLNPDAGLTLPITSAKSKKAPPVKARPMTKGRKIPRGRR